MYSPRLAAEVAVDRRVEDHPAEDHPGADRRVGVWCRGAVAVVPVPCPEVVEVEVCRVADRMVVLADAYRSTADGVRLGLHHTR